MKVSASIEIVLQLAAQEAIAAQFKEIEPEHLLEAVLKLSELPVDEVGKMNLEAGATEDLAIEVDAIRERLAEQSIDSIQVRRRLREQLGSGRNRYEGGLMHRSQASRCLFDAAANLADDAGEETLTAKFMLEAILASPTLAIAQVLGKIKAVGAKDHKRPKTPVLDQLGRDLAEQAPDDGSLTPGLKAASKMLLRALIEGSRPGVFLVSDSAKAAQSVVRVAAVVLRAKDCPKSLKGKRIIDLTGIDIEGTDQKEAEYRLRTALVEARIAKNVIVYMPPLLPPRASTTSAWWTDLLRSTMVGGHVQYVCRASHFGYRHVEKDPVWRKCAVVMWIHDEGKGELPGEL